MKPLSKLPTENVVHTIAVTGSRFRFLKDAPI